MLFFPFKADITLGRIPFLTIFISIACLVIYWQQSASDNEFAQYTSTFCEKQNDRSHKLVLSKIAQSNHQSKSGMCETLYSSIYLSADALGKINEITQSTTKFNSRSLKSTHLYVYKILTEKYKKFDLYAPQNLTKKLFYEPASFNILKMLTSSFSHGSWMHVTGNLFFFFAFSATVEVILGLLLFPLVIIALAIGTNLVYSISLFTTAGALPTLGLSGVVMGMMGLFAYFIPTAKIRCFFWFIVIVKRFGVPAWLLALWYFSWDVYDLYLTGNTGGVNLIAHVSGFIEGFLIGLIFFKARKIQVQAELRSSNNNKEFSKAMS